VGQTVPTRVETKPMSGDPYAEAALSWRPFFFDANQWELPEPCSRWSNGADRLDACTVPCRYADHGGWRNIHPAVRDVLAGIQHVLLGSRQRLRCLPRDRAVRQIRPKSTPSDIIPIEIARRPPVVKSDRGKASCGMMRMRSAMPMIPWSAANAQAATGGARTVASYCASLVCKLQRIILTKTSRTLQ
jgi:hypothetical protein